MDADNPPPDAPPSFVPVPEVPTRRLSRSTIAKISAPLLLGAGALVVVGFAMQPGDDSLRTEEASTTSAVTTTAPTTTEAVFSEPETTASTAPPTAAPTTLATTTLAPTTTTTTTTTTVAPTTSALEIQQTQPVAPPPDARGYEPVVQLGRIAIPKLGVDQPMYEGIRLTTLDRGPGHWPGTAMPGQIGNVVVAGHRTSHGGVFRYIDQLVPGDTVVFTTDAGTLTYQVTGTQIVTPDAVWIINPTDTPTATLFACHPPGSVAQRIVVNLALVQ